MHFFRSFLLAVILLSQSHVTAMDLVPGERLSILDMPNEIWANIFYWMNFDIERSLSQDGSYYYDIDRVYSMSKAIKRLIPCTLVCRLTNVLAVDAIMHYLERAGAYLEHAGAKMRFCTVS